VSQKEKHMSFILRAAFWLTVLAFLLPAAGWQADSGQSAGAGMNPAAPAAYVTHVPGGADGTAASAGQADMDAAEVLTLAARSAEDVMGFCSRNPDVCERSHAIVAHVARQTAYYGGKVLIWLTEQAKEQQRQHDTPGNAPAPAAVTPPVPATAPPAARITGA
jgi:hypothetical protein